VATILEEIERGALFLTLPPLLEMRVFFSRSLVVTWPNWA